MVSYLVCRSGKPVEKRVRSDGLTVLACYGELHGVVCPKGVNVYMLGKDCLVDLCDPAVVGKDCEVYP